MPINSLDQLRANAPEGYKIFPDDALICLYKRDLKLDLPDGQVFDYLNVEQRPILLNCDQVIHLHSFFLPKSFYVVGFTTLFILLVGLLIYRSLNKKIPVRSKFNLGFKLGLLGVFVSVVLLIPNLLRFDVVTALTYTVGWFLITVPLLFLFGFVFHEVKEADIAGVSHFFFIKINKIINRRKSREVWLKISEEMDSGVLDKALWSQCFARAEGNEPKAKSYYMKARYDQLDN
jgi:hypothetical protein